MAETIDERARKVASQCAAYFCSAGPEHREMAATILGTIESALLAVAREQREQALDEAIDVVMEIRTDAPNWKEQAVESLTAIRNSGENSNEG